MSDQDNLRNRMAKAIHREECSCGEDVAEEWELQWAQAIIDEFELTTETHAATHAKRTMTRITGAWEWDNQ